MATATKTKKAPAKKAAAKKAPDTKKETKNRAIRMPERDLDLAKQVAELRNSDPQPKWSEVAEQLGISQGKAMFLYEVSKVRPKDRIKWEDEDDLAAKVVEARNEGLSWGIIMARTGLGEGVVRKAFERGGGGSARGHRIGRGGRLPAGVEPKPKEKAPAKKAAAKKAPAKKAAAASAGTSSGVVKNLNDMTGDELNERLSGKTITVGRGSSAKRIKVKNVLSLVDGEMEFTDAKNGGVRTVSVNSITKASR